MFLKYTINIKFIKMVIFEKNFEINLKINILDWNILLKFLIIIFI